jgi:hypothetical protein
MTTTFRCIACGSTEPDMSELYDGVPVCFCGEICATVHLCEQCSNNEASCGETLCIECLCDTAIEDPTAIAFCTQSTKDEIIKTMAARLKPWLSRKQAA